MLALDEFVDHARAKRPGAVEGEHGYEIFEAGGVQHAQVLTHTGSFDLEDTVRIAAGIEVVSGLIREGQDIEIRRLLTLQFDVIQSILNKRHGLEAEKVEFDKARLLDHGAVKLGDLLAVFAPEEGEVLDHWLVRNHKSGRMHAGLPGEALQLHGDVKEMPDLWFRVVALLELWLLLKYIADVDLGIVAGRWPRVPGTTFPARGPRHG